MGVGDLWVEVFSFFLVDVPTVLHGGDVQPVCVLFHEVEVPGQDGGACGGF